MRSQFYSVLKDFCRRRSQQRADIKWWFSERDERVPQPYRVGSDPFTDEGTIPFGRDSEVETLDDPPLEDDFFHSVGFA